MSDSTQQTAALAVLADVAIELPSWAFGNSGTRFKVFPTAGRAPRTRTEKIADAAQVHRLTGLGAVGRAAHPVGQGRRLRRAVARTPPTTASPRDDQHQHVPGRRLQVRQPDPRDKAVRQKAIDHHLECIDIMDATGSRDLKIWLADGPNYPGQDDLRARQDNLAESLATIYSHIGEDQRLVLEYKFFEPAFYSTDVPDWGTAYAQVLALGERAVVCLDTGHHAPGTNIEYIVAHAAAARQARLVRLQQPLLRRRRPDRRRRGSLPALPHHVRRSCAAAGWTRPRASRSCSTSATTSRRRSPVRSARCSTCRR